MMIHVKVSEAHPFCIGHLTKLRMTLPLEVSWVLREAIHEAPQKIEYRQIKRAESSRRSAGTKPCTKFLG
jgi:hypothetical protein